MGDNILNGVIETIDSAHDHQLKLAELLNALAESKTQVDCFVCSPLSVIKRMVERGT